MKRNITNIALCALMLFLSNKTLGQRLEKIEVSLAIDETIVKFEPLGKTSGSVGPIAYELTFVSGVYLDSVIERHLGSEGVYKSLEIQRDVSQFRLRKTKERGGNSTQDQDLSDIIRSLFLRGVFDKHTRDALMNRLDEDKRALEETFAAYRINNNYSRQLNAKVTALKVRMCNSSTDWRTFAPEKLIVQDNYATRGYSVEDIASYIRINNLETQGHFLKLLGVGSELVAPGTCINKYYLFPPIDPTAGDVQLHIQGATPHHTWSVQQTTNTKSSRVSYYSLRLVNEVEGETLNERNSIFTLIGDDAESIQFNDDEILIPEELLEGEFRLVCVANIDGKTYVGTELIKPLDYIDLTKLRSKSIYIKYMEI